MAFNREDLDLCIALALTRVSDADRKAYSDANWIAQERAIHSMAKYIGDDVRRRFDFALIEVSSK